MKIKFNITKKVFLFSILPIFLLFVLLISSQYLFFNDFYINEKNKLLRSNVIKLKEYIDDYTFNDRKIKSLIYKFQENYNVKVAILNSDGTIQISMTPHDDDIIKEYAIINKAITYWLNSDNYYKVIFSKEISSYEFSTGSQEHYSVISAPLDSDNPKILFVVSTLQPVDEANWILKKYYFYFILASFIIIIMVAVFLSRLLTKPLIQLNKTAGEMSNLNFDAHCTVNSKDELGELGGSLNTLSAKLDTTLKELTEANKKLQLDIEKERELEKMRREFIGDISHELKTPISIVRGYAEALNDGVVDEEDTQFYTQTIIEEMESLNFLVKDMLNLSRLENDPYCIAKQDIELIPYIKNLSRKYEKHLKNHNFTLNISSSAEAADDKVSIDSKRIEEVLNNFIANAERYTHFGNKISLNVHYLGDVFKIAVYNDGENIPDDSLEKIWDKFYRTDKSRTKSSGGSGLGLAISKKILLHHDSDFGINNTPSGVVFYFTLS